MKPRVRVKKPSQKVENISLRTESLEKFSYENTNVHEKLRAFFSYLDPEELIAFGVLSVSIVGTNNFEAGAFLNALKKFVEVKKRDGQFDTVRIDHCFNTCVCISIGGGTREKCSAFSIGEDTVKLKKLPKRDKDQPIEPGEVTLSRVIYFGAMAIEAQEKVVSKFWENKPDSVFKKKGIACRNHHLGYEHRVTSKDDLGDYLEIYFQYLWTLTGEKIKPIRRELFEKTHLVGVRTLMSRKVDVRSLGTSTSLWNMLMIRYNPEGKVEKE